MSEQYVVELSGLPYNFVQPCSFPTNFSENRQRSKFNELFANYSGDQCVIFGGFSSKFSNAVSTVLCWFAALSFVCVLSSAHSFKNSRILQVSNAVSICFE